MAEHVIDVVVIGAGVAGLAASYHAAARGASVVCFEGGSPGGQVASVGSLDDFPVTAPTSGASLADTMMRRAGDLGVTFTSANVMRVDRAGDHFDVSTDDATHRARRVVLAMGSRRRVLDVPGEEEFTKRGVSDCAWCDGGLFRNDAVAVIGGGDAAVQAALHLASLCRRVTLIVRGSGLRARQRYASLAADNSRLDFAWETRVEAFAGNAGLERIVVCDAIGGSRREMAVAGAFVYVGTVPAGDVIPAGVDRDDHGRAKSGREGRTSLAGVYACGSVASVDGGGIASALAQGEQAGKASAADASLMRSPWD